MFGYSEPCLSEYANTVFYWEKRGPKINIMSFCRCDNKYIYIVKWGKRASKNIFIENNVVIFKMYIIFLIIPEFKYQQVVDNSL